MNYLRLKVKKNMFYVKKIQVRDRLFLLLIRRDERIFSLLECFLYDISSLQSIQPQIGSGKQNTK